MRFGGGRHLGIERQKTIAESEGIKLFDWNKVEPFQQPTAFADPMENSMLVISEQASVEGEVRAEHVVVDGAITGPVYCSELLELQPKARITGDVHYKALEMHGGALVSGKLTHQQDADQVLKLASPKLASSL